jgi:hypothetical protein
VAVQISTSLACSSTSLKQFDTSSSKFFRWFGRDPFSLANVANIQRERGAVPRRILPQTFP